MPMPTGAAVWGGKPAETVEVGRLEVDSVDDEVDDVVDAVGDPVVEEAAFEGRVSGVLHE